MAELCPVCHHEYDAYLRCNRGDCHDGRMKPIVTVDAPTLTGAIAAQSSFKRELAVLLERHNKGTSIGMPNDILAEYLSGHIENLRQVLVTWRSRT